MAQSRRSGQEARQLARAGRLYEAGDFAAADALYRQVLQGDGENLEALCGRAQALAAASGQLPDARRNGRAAGHQAEELCSVASECYIRGLWQDAIACYSRALDFAPENSEALWGVADCMASIGKTAEAIEWFHRYLEVEPDEPEALHMLAALGERPSPERASDAYVATHFDRFAADFDHQLVDELEYRAPDQLLAAVTAAAGAGEGGLDVLDLGCGTGLCGIRFRPFAQRLDGIDLSRGMLREARARGVYDSLRRAEIGAHLAVTKRRYDLILAADVLIYIGALDGLFDGVGRVARPGTLFAFSAEALAKGTYRLMPSGRYAHARAYIRRLAAAGGWQEVSLGRESIRLEYARPVPGDIWVLRKGA